MTSSCSLSTRAGRGRDRHRDRALAALLGAGGFAINPRLGVALPAIRRRREVRQRRSRTTRQPRPPQPPRVAGDSAAAGRAGGARPSSSSSTARGEQPAQEPAAVLSGRAPLRRTALGARHRPGARAAARAGSSALHRPALHAPWSGARSWAALRVRTLEVATRRYRSTRRTPAPGAPAAGVEVGGGF